MAVAGLPFLASSPFRLGFLFVSCRLEDFCGRLLSGQNNPGSQGNTFIGLAITDRSFPGSRTPSFLLSTGWSRSSLLLGTIEPSSALLFRSSGAFIVGTLPLGVPELRRVDHEHFLALAVLFAVRFEDLLLLERDLEHPADVFAQLRRQFLRVSALLDRLVVVQRVRRVAQPVDRQRRVGDPLNFEVRSELDAFGASPNVRGAFSASGTHSGETLVERALGHREDEDDVLRVLEGLSQCSL